MSTPPMLLWSMALLYLYLQIDGAVEVGEQVHCILSMYSFVLVSHMTNTCNRPVLCQAQSCVWQCMVRGARVTDLCCVRHSRVCGNVWWEL